MVRKLDSLTETLLMGPGPSCVPQSVYDALARPTIGHLDPRFIEIMDDIQSMLRSVMATGNRLTLPISGTGSAGMETCFANLVEPGDRVLVLENGVFGRRMQDVASRYGAQTDVLEFRWGSPVDIDAVTAKLRKQHYTLVAVVHAETSTGVCNPVSEIGTLLQGSQTLYLVDSVTGLGGIPVLTDEWGVDALYSGTQKCLSCPPGLAPVTLSDRAVAKLKNRTTRVSSWYLDLSLIIDYWAGQKRSYHHTAPINMLYALHEALALLMNEGVEAAYERHATAHERLVAGLASLGLEMFVDEPHRLPMLNAVTVPDGVDEASVRRRLLEEHDIEIGAGLGDLAGRVWRIGLMGHTARAENVDRFLEALAAVL